MDRPLGRKPKITTRITVAFSDKATQWLVTEADHKGTTVPETIRRIIDDVRFNGVNGVTQERNAHYDR